MQGYISLISNLFNLLEPAAELQNVYHPFISINALFSPLPLDSLLSGVSCLFISVGKLIKYYVGDTEPTCWEVVLGFAVFSYQSVNNYFFKYFFCFFSILL